jgi:hypothetical protein
MHVEQNAFFMRFGVRDAVGMPAGARVWMQVEAPSPKVSRS